MGPSCGALCHLLHRMLLDFHSKFHDFRCSAVVVVPEVLQALDSPSQELHPVGFLSFLTTRRRVRSLPWPGLWELDELDHLCELVKALIHLLAPLLFSVPLPLHAPGLSV